MKKVMEVLMNLSKDPLVQRHFEIWTDNLNFDVQDGSELCYTVDNIMMYEWTSEGKKPFRPNKTAWAGYEITVYHAFDDLMNRLTRNETGIVSVLYLDSEIKAHVESFRKKPALEFEGRKIPYEVIYEREVYHLAYATDRFLYYVDKYDTLIIMLHTNDGTLVADNAFAEIGFYESQQDVEEGKEKAVEIIIPNNKGE